MIEQRRQQDFVDDCTKLGNELSIAITLHQLGIIEF